MSDMFTMGAYGTVPHSDTTQLDEPVLPKEEATDICSASDKVFLLCPGESALEKLTQAKFSCLKNQCKVHFCDFFGGCREKF